MATVLLTLQLPLDEFLNLYGNEVFFVLSLELNS